MLCKDPTDRLERWPLRPDFRLVEVVVDEDCECAEGLDGRSAMLLPRAGRPSRSSYESKASKGVDEKSVCSGKERTMGLSGLDMISYEYVECGVVRWRVAIVKSQ